MTASLRGVLARVWRQSQDHRLAMTAASVAFYVLLGSMPGLAAVVWLYGTFANPDVVLSTVSWLLFILWSANQGMRGLVDALNQIYRRSETRSFLIRVAQTVAMTVGASSFSSSRPCSP